MSSTTAIINQYKQFITAHTANKENKLPITNTRIGNKSSDKGAIIYGGSYSIPDEEYSDFLKLYSKYVFECGQSEYLTEKQREESGAIAIDVDFRYDYSVCERIHTIEHIDNIIELYLEKIKGMFEPTTVPFYIYVMEKDEVNRVEDKENPDESITKDGIHIIIPIATDRVQRIMLREQIVEAVGKV